MPQLSKISKKNNKQINTRLQNQDIKLRNKNSFVKIKKLTAEQITQLFVNQFNLIQINI